MTLSEDPRCLSMTVAQNPVHVNSAGDMMITAPKIHWALEPSTYRL